MNPSDQPKEKCFRCGTELLGRWWPSPDHRPSRWLMPENPCSTCAASKRRAEELAALAARQRQAEIPERFRPYDLDLVDTRPNDLDMDLWFDRVKRSRPVTIGLHKGNIRAHKSCVGFRNDPVGVWLYGQTGTGKSLLAAATLTWFITEQFTMTRSLMPLEQIRHTYGRGVEQKEKDRRAANPDEPVWKAPMPFTVVKRGRVPRRPLFMPMGELAERLRLSSNLDKDPLRKIGAVPLLCLDDLGSENPEEWSAFGTKAHDAVRQIVDYRSRNMLPTLFTSNVAIDELGERLGDRTTSRLREMVKYEVEVVGPDLRGAAL